MKRRQSTREGIIAPVMTPGRRLAVIGALAPLCAAALSCSAKGGDVSAASGDVGHSSSAAATSIASNPASPTETTSPATSSAENPVTPTTTPSTALAKIACTGFKVEADGPNNKRIIPAIPNLTRTNGVVTIAETFDTSYPLASASGVGVTVAPPYAGDLTVGNETAGQNGQIRVTVVDFESIGGLPDPLPATLADKPDGAIAYGCN